MAGSPELVEETVRVVLVAIVVLSALAPVALFEHIYYVPSGDNITYWLPPRGITRVARFGRNGASADRTGSDGKWIWWTSGGGGDCAASKSNAHRNDQASHHRPAWKSAA